MKLLIFFRPWLLPAILAMNFIFPFLVKLKFITLSPGNWHVIAANHYCQMIALLLIWLLARPRRPVELKLTIAAALITAVNIFSQYNVFSMTVGWCLTAAAATDTASYLTRWARDRKVYSSAVAQGVIWELQQNRSISNLKLMITVTAMLDCLLVIIYCFKPGFNDNFLPTIIFNIATAIGFAAFPLFLMMCGRSRLELVCLSGLAAMTGFMVDLRLLYSLWGHFGANYIRLLESLELHITISGLLAQACIILSLGIISIKIFKKNLPKKTKIKPLPQKPKELMVVPIFTGIIFASVVVAFIISPSMDLYREVSKSPNIWEEQVISHHLGDVEFELPVDLRPTMQGDFSLSLSDENFTFTETCRLQDSIDHPDFPHTKEPFTLEPYTLFDETLDAKIGIPARLIIFGSENFNNPDAKPAGNNDIPQQLTLSLTFNFKNGVLELSDKINITDMESDRSEILKNTADNFKIKADKFLNNYNWFGQQKAPWPSPGYATACGRMKSLDGDFSGGVKFKNENGDTVTLAYGHRLRGFSLTAYQAATEIQALYATGKKPRYSLKAASGHRGMERRAIFASGAPLGAVPKNTKYIFNWFPDNFNDIALSLQFSSSQDGAQIKHQAQHLWEPMLDSLKVVKPLP